MNNSFKMKHLSQQQNNSSGEIILQTKGNSVILIDDCLYKIRQNDVIVLPKNCTYKITTDSACSQMYLKVNDMDFSHMCIVHDKNMYIRSLMNVLYHIYLEKKENYSMVSGMILEIIYFHIKELLNSGSNNTFVKKMQNNIYKNIDNINFDLPAEMENYGFSADYSRKKFKEEIGMTPHEYLISLRINRAKFLLMQDSFVSVANVAEQCGFNDSFYFSNCFKKNVGLSPLQYRKKTLQ